MRCNAAVAGLNAALDDGEAETGAAGFAVAGIFKAVEGLEDAVEGIGWNTGALVLNENADFGTLLLGCDVDGAGFAGIADGVAEQVGHGAVEGLVLGQDLKRGVDIRSDFDAGTGLGLDGAPDKIGQGQGREMDRVLPHFGLGEFQQAVGESGHDFDVLGEVLQIFGAGCVHLAVENAEGELHAAQR